MKHCKDCDKEITKQAKRCKQCWQEYHSQLMKGKYKGKNNPNYKDGRFCKKYYCKICGKGIHKDTVIYGFGRCKSCQISQRNIKDWKNPKYRKRMIKIISRKAKKRLSIPQNNPMYGIPSPHGKKIKYKGNWMRSSWEVAFAKYCIKNHIKYRYESKTFDLGNMTYTPDFYLPETDTYIEIKGWWRDKAKVKFNAFKNKYSKVKIKVLMKKNLEKLLGLAFQEE